MAEEPTPRAPFAPRERREPSRGFSLEANAERVGRYAWAETTLSEVLGRWVGTVPETDVARRIGSHCHKHAWHAELWRARLPELGEMNPDRMTRPANDAMVRFIEAMSEPEAPELTIEKLVGVYRVFIPRFIAAYTHHLDSTDEITDAPSVRALRFILQDEIDDWRDGETLLQSLITTPKMAARAAEHQSRLESLMIEAGGVAGHGSI